MATQGPNFPGTITTASVLPEDDNDWTNAVNVGANDGSEATITAATYDANDISFQLRARNLGFTIPTGSTITGITVEIEKRDQAIGAAVDNRVQLTDASGTLVGDNKADTVTDWPTAATIITYGGSSDTWNASPTVAMVNDPDFGVTLSVKATAANTDIFVDFIRVTITYTPPDSKARIAGFEFETPLPNSKARISGFEFETPLVNSKARISGFEFEAPFANAKARLSGFEFEAPTANSKARISGFEFETPNSDRKALISGFEFEVPPLNAKARLSGFELESPGPNSKCLISVFEFEAPDLASPPSDILWTQLYYNPWLR